MGMANVNTCSRHIPLMTVSLGFWALRMRLANAMTQADDAADKIEAVLEERRVFGAEIVGTDPK
jgi:hypothetical protein